MSEEHSSDILIRARKLAATGHTGEARNLARHACDVDGDNVNNWLSFGNLSGRLQLFDEAIESFGRAVELAPSDARTHAGLANACYAAGRLDDAATACRRALELEPDDPDKWYLQATLYGLLERHEESESCLRRVTELAPTHAMAYRSLGYMLQVQNRLDEALEAYRHAVECQPGFADAYNDIGVVLQEQGNTKEAIAQYRSALGIKPDFIDAMMNLGGLLLTQNNPEEALTYFRSVLAIDGDNPKALCALGSALFECGRIDDAYASFSRALTVDAACEEATVKIARLRERQGRHDEALELLRPIVDRGDNADAVAAFALLSTHFSLENEAIAMLERALNNARLSAAQRREMHFSLGRLYDRKREYDLAYRNFESGNRLKAAEFRLQDHIRLVDSLIDTYSRENLRVLAHSPAPDRQAVFILGMPRSGTSLVEQILSVHPQVQAAGELVMINRFAARMHEKLHTGSTYPVAALQLTPGNAGALTRSYLAGLPAEGHDKPFFTDKMPQNFLHLGLIEQLFPNARIVHCVRDARDTCISCYSYDFNGEHPYAYDLETLGAYYLQYQRLMKHWQDVLGIPIYTLEYEKLVSDQAQEVRRLLAFCGIEWDERCLASHASGRVVLTSSYDQVRQPVYSSSVGRWKHYKRHIQPLLDALRLAE